MCHDMYRSVKTSADVEKCRRTESSEDVNKCRGNETGSNQMTDESQCWKCKCGEHSKCDGGDCECKHTPAKHGWLIEKSGLCLGVCGSRFSWVTFTDDKAIRFARKCDAERLRDALVYDCRIGKEVFRDVVITEHLWSQSDEDCE